MKYKFILPLILLAAVLMAPSCQNKEQMKTDATDKVEGAAVTTEATDDIEQPDTRMENDSLFLTYERTPCFGRCPIFKIRLYKSGYVTYEGINFVDNMGYYDARATEKQMRILKEQIDEAGYADWKESYDDKKISDLPAQIFSIEIDGVQKRVVARYQVPDEVKQFGLFIENIFRDTQWVPVAHDH